MYYCSDVHHQLSCHTASVARHMYLRPGAGVGAMQKIYGGQLLYTVTCSFIHGTNVSQISSVVKIYNCIFTK